MNTEALDRRIKNTEDVLQAWKDALVGDPPDRALIEENIEGEQYRLNELKALRARFDRKGPGGSDAE